METAAAAPARNTTIDGLKYVAAAGIVLHHASAAAGGLAQVLTTMPLPSLFFFFAVSGYFHGTTGSRGMAWLRARVDRLALPYVAWTVFFMIWGQRFMLSGGEPYLPGAVSVVFFAGAHGILWSLALLIYIAVGVELFVRSATHRRLAIVAGVVITLLIYVFGSMDAINANPASNFLLASRYAVAYLAGMEIRDAGERRMPAWLFEALAVAGILALGLARVFIAPVSQTLDVTVETVLWIGVALLVLRGAATGVQWFGVRHLAWGRDYLIGVYVTHVIWLPYVVLDWIPAGSMPDIVRIPAVWALTLLLATATVWLLRTNKFTRAVVA